MQCKCEYDEQQEINSKDMKDKISWSRSGTDQCSSSSSFPFGGCTSLRIVLVVVVSGVQGPHKYVQSYSELSG
jgi:hypothetical protein